MFFLLDIQPVINQFLLDKTVTVVTAENDGLSLYMKAMKLCFNCPVNLPCC